MANTASMTLNTSIDNYFTQPYHQLLGQANKAKGPTGEHFQYSSAYKFPHDDSLGICWQPQGYDVDIDKKDTDRWLDYEDSVSEVMRAECDLQPWMSVCEIPLYWEEVDCEIYIDRAKKKADEKRAKEKEEGKQGKLPMAVVITFQILSGIWKALAIGMVGFPWWFLLATIAAFDWVLDWVFLLTFGLFCTPCAGFFIWVVNIALLPFSIWGYIYRFFLEIYGLFIDGWMLPFGNGCFLKWGNQCWLQKDFSMRKALDIPLFTILPEDNSSSSIDNLTNSFMKLITPPKIEKNSEILLVRRQNRKNLFSAVPIIGELMSVMDYAYMNIDF